jgi:small subunit ribosomal protein S20
MANIKSAQKRARQSFKRRQKNLNRKTALKSAIKKVEVALEAGQAKEVTVALLRTAEGHLARAKNKGVLHANTSSRKISRLAHRVAAAYKK